MEKCNIDLDFNDKKCIVNGIIKGIKMSQKYFNENRKITDNGRPGERWNYINEEVKEKLAGRFEVVLCDRKPWQFILIYNKETKSIYSLMKEKRLKELKNNIKSNRMHYSAVLATFLNSQFEYEEKYQMTFLEDDNNIDEKKLEANFQEITKSIYGDIDKYTMITFTNRDDELISVCARIVSPSLDDIYKENWSDLIHLDYNDVISEIQADVSLDDDTDEKIDLPIKDDIMRKHNKEDINIQLKKHQEKKQKTM